MEGLEGEAAAEPASGSEPGTTSASEGASIVRGRQADLKSWLK